jgi:hypothetical protein
MTVTSISTNREPAPLCVPMLPLRQCTATRMARSAALFVGSNPSVHERPQGCAQLQKLSAHPARLPGFEQPLDLPPEVIGRRPHCRDRLHARADGTNACVCPACPGCLPGRHPRAWGGSFDGDHDADRAAQSGHSWLDDVLPDGRHQAALLPRATTTSWPHRNIGRADATDTEASGRSSINIGVGVRQAGWSL